MDADGRPGLETSGLALGLAEVFAVRDWKWLREKE